jgi:CRAL/TRIO domain/CRAL/TRIO, N-terminal domain
MVKHEYTGYLDDMSPEQEEVLNRLRTHLREELGNTDPRYDDRFLLRFCRARKFDYPKVQLMFDNNLKWRQENKVDTIAEEDFPLMKDCFQFAPHNYMCIDRIGRPVYVERYRNFDLKEMMKVTEVYKIVEREYMLRYFIYSYERLMNLILPALNKKGYEKHIEQSVTILDLDGLAFFNVLGKRDEIQTFLKMVSSITQDNYPETMGRLFIVNAPMLFSALWSVVKGFLDAKTVKKISVHGNLN